MKSLTLKASPAARQYWFRIKRIAYVFVAIIFSFGPFVLLNETASAAQITNRSLTISTAVPGNTTTTYTFGFKVATAGAIQAMTFQFCTTPLGTCTAPTGFTITGSTTPTLGNFAGSIASETQDVSGSHTPDYTNAIACNLANIYCVTWSDASSDSAGTALTATFTNVTNPSSINSAFYARVSDWSTSSFTSTLPVDSGNVAASTSQTLTTNATIQEYLNFCVGAVNGTGPESVAGNLTGGGNSCSAISGSSLNLGILSTSFTNVSPNSAAGTNGDGNQGVAEVTSNAGNGTVVSYNSISQGGSGQLGTLKVNGATCSGGSSTTDQCINDSSSGLSIVTGTENWGMAIPGINCSDVTAYTCNATSHNLVVQSPYYCTSADATTSFTTTDAGGQDTGTSNCNYAWDDSGGSDTIASSAASSTKVVGGEALLMEFAATPSLTTPTGIYAAQANFVATPTY